jgi:hypothetical protein
MDRRLTRLTAYRYAANVLSHIDFGPWDLVALDVDINTHMFTPICTRFLRHFFVPRGTTGAHMKATSASLLLSLVCVTVPALAQAPPDYGLNWATVGAPGNRNTIPSEVPDSPTTAVGAVVDTFRVTRTEITAASWFQFVLAYAPYTRWSPDDSAFTSNYIQHYGSGLGDYSLNPQAGPYSVNVGWRYAAIYCNWLCNGKGSTASAFESGAYDISTFTNNLDGSVNDQLTRSPGALFWIPSRSEWVKSGYYDPNRYGPGQGGYWHSPNGTDDPLAPGLPGIGQTDAGSQNDPILQPAGSYPNVQSPWGVLDISGGRSEWTENVVGTYAANRDVLGSQYASPLWLLLDHPEAEFSYEYIAFQYGFRVASAVPSPSAFAAMLAVSALIPLRRRK